MDEKEFERRSKLSIYWLNESTNLRGSAAAVWASMDDDVSTGIAERFALGASFSMKGAVPPVFRMLCGLSLELLYKAVIVNQHQKIPPAKHKLPMLAEMAGVPVTAKDKRLLEILTEEITWAGRYPLPKERQDVAKLKALRLKALYDRKPLGKRYFLTPNGALSWNGFDRLWRQGAELYEHHKHHKLP